MMIRTIEEAVESILASYSTEECEAFRENFRDTFMVLVIDILEKIDHLEMRAGNIELLQACTILALENGEETEHLLREENYLLSVILDRLKAGT
jgi:hypothetical protein